MEPFQTWNRDILLDLIESLPDPYLVLDKHLVIQGASKVYMETTHSTVERIVGKSIFDAFPANPELPDGDGVENLRNSLLQVLQTKKAHKMPVQRYDIMNVNRNGFEKKYWSPINTPVLDAEGSVCLIIHKVVDVTELVEKQEEIKELNISTLALLSREENAYKEAELQRNLLMNTFRQAPVAIGIYKGPDHVVELINKSMYEFLRISVDQLEGKPLFTVKPELVAQGTKERLDYVLKTGESYVGKKIGVHLKGKDGKVYFNVVNQPMTDLQGNTIGVISMAVEVTEEINALQEAENSKNRFRDLANAIPHIVWTANENGLIEYINMRWVEYTGLSVEESQGWEWIKALHPEDQEKTKDQWQKAVESGDEFLIEYKIRSAGGSYRWFRVNAIAVRENGLVKKWYGTSTDIHDQKQVMERLEKVSRELKNKNNALRRVNSELDTFVYTASHDLKAPIINLEGLFKLLLESIETGEDTSSLVTMISSSFDRFKGTLRDLAEIIKVARQDPLDVEMVGLEKMLEEASLNMESLICESKAIIRSDFQVSKIRFSRKNLRSLFYNFISNSIKYRHPVRTPDILIKSSKTAEGRVLLTISDNGLGMEAEKKDKVFNMFTRLHNHVAGSGIGLYIVKRMIENAGGHIEVESQPNEGTTFKIYLKQ